MKRAICFFFGFLICVCFAACKVNIDGIADETTGEMKSLDPKFELPTPMTVVEPTLTSKVEPPFSAPTESIVTSIPDTQEPDLPTQTPGPTSTIVPQTPIPISSPSDEEIDRLNELLSESYKLLTEDERDAFEELYDSFYFRYFDDKFGYAYHYATCYGVFSGVSVWLLPGDTADEYENTVCGYTFYYSSGCLINAFKDGNVCEIHVAYREGWLTEEDIAKLYEIHTLMLRVYSFSSRTPHSIEDVERLNELVTESYKLLTETERVAFEESHESLRKRIRYFDVDYDSDYITSYGVFSGASVWLMPDVTDEGYEITVNGYVFAHKSGGNIIAFKDGEECGIDTAFSKGWLTEEDIATLYEIHTLTELVYY